VGRLNSGDARRRMALQGLRRRACEGEEAATCGGGRLARLFHWLHDHRRPIRQHFGDALHDLRSVVTSAYDCVFAQFGGVLAVLLFR
jgi:hypothetical protein